MILLAGSVVQHVGVRIIWQYSHTAGQAYYEWFMIVMELALCLYVVTAYLEAEIPKDGKYYGRLVTVSLGVIGRMVLMETSELTTEDIYLAFRVVVLLFCTIYLLSKRKYSLADMIPFTLGAHSALYMSSYALEAWGLKIILLSNNFMIMAMYTTWMVAGMWQLYRRGYA